VCPFSKKFVSAIMGFVAQDGCAYDFEGMDSPPVSQEGDGI